MKIHNLFNTFIPAQTLVLQVTEILMLTATNEAKNFLLANFVLSWDDPKTFQVLIVQCSNWGAQNKHSFVWKCINSIDCCIILAEMPFN